MNKQRLTAALELIGVLAERFPACFAVNPSYRQPLKLGIHVDILAQLSDTIAPRDLSAALRIYVSNSKYLKALVTGADRVDLNGMPAGTVSAEHADIAKAQYEQRRDKQKAKQKQLAPTNGAGKPELYHVTTIVKKYNGRKNVAFEWFRCERRAPRSYADLIENYDPYDHYVYYPRGCIDGIFELDEAQALKDYIDQNYGEDQGITTIEKAELPIANDAMCVGAMPVGGGNDFYLLDKAPNYSLPFRVWGYFDLRDEPPCDQRGLPGATECAYDGLLLWLHSHCRRPWIDAYEVHRSNGAWASS